MIIFYWDSTGKVHQANVTDETIQDLFFTCVDDLDWSGDDEAKWSHILKENPL